MKHIVLFSGGAGSSYMAWLVLQEQSKEDVILLHTPTYSEHPDADRFREQVAKFLDLPITVQADGRDIWELAMKHHCLPNYFRPFCSDELKNQQMNKFFKNMDDEFKVYTGYTREEWRRVQKASARMDSKGIKYSFPLFENNISSDQCKKIISNNWKICLPEPYLCLKHNNCIPCFKGGKSHFYSVWRYYPDYFKKAVELEKELFKTVFKNITLEELGKQWDNGQIEIFNDTDFRPCLCSY